MPRNKSKRIKKIVGGLQASFTYEIIRPMNNESLYSIFDENHNVLTFLDIDSARKEAQSEADAWGKFVEIYCQGVIVETVMPSY